MDVKPIETYYNGYRFRSRLEARVAVLFDRANIKYQYEPEGFESDGVCYLPDFYLPDEDFYVEVKPIRDGFREEIAKAAKVICRGLYKPLLVITDIPSYSSNGSVWWHTMLGVNTITDELIAHRVFLYSGNPVEDGTDRSFFHGRDFYEGRMDDVCMDRILNNSNEKLEKFFSPLHGKETASDEWSVFELFHSKKIDAAYTAARQARFEYGETPRI